MPDPGVTARVLAHDVEITAAEALGRPLQPPEGRAYVNDGEVGSPATDPWVVRARTTPKGNELTGDYVDTFHLNKELDVKSLDPKVRPGGSFSYPPIPPKARSVWTHLNRGNGPRSNCLGCHSLLKATNPASGVRSALLGGRG